MSDHPYQAAYDLKWDRNYNYLLTDDEIVERKRRWVQWIDACRPLTKEIYQTMDKDEQRQYRVGAWALNGGLNVVSGGKAMKAFRGIQNYYEDIAAKRAMEERKEAGWWGQDFLTDPTGEDGSGVGNGQRWGRFTRPWMPDARGKWDGQLKGAGRFTR